MRIQRACACAFVLAAACSVAAACTGTGTGPSGPPALVSSLPRPLTGAEREIQTAANDFSFQMLQRLSASDESANLIFSPLSVSFALGMAMNGAEGETYDQMRQTLGFGTLGENAINEGYRGLVSLLLGLDASVDILLANSVWHESSFPVRQPFIHASTTYFDAGVFARDFGSPATVDDINGWVSSSTKGRIPAIIENIRDDEVMFLINAIYFRGDWRLRFDPRDTRAAPFHSANGTVREVPMMSRRSDSLSFILDSDVTAASLPYGNGSFAMALLRPSSGQSLDAFVAALTYQKWSELLPRFSIGKAVLRMPRFELDYKRSLRPDLEALGMIRPFDSGEAEFGRLAAVQERMYISRVEHRGAVTVDELGSTAAAATSVGIGIVSAPPQLDFDRPFVFVIYEQLAGTVLFIGKVVELPPG